MFARIVRVVPDSSRYAGVKLGAAVPGIVARSAEEVEHLMARHLVIDGPSGASWQTWLWVLSGTVASPITVSPPPDRPPTDAEIAAELANQTGTYGSQDELVLCREILEWITGRSDKAPNFG